MPAIHRRERTGSRSCSGYQFAVRTLIIHAPLAGYYHICTFELLIKSDRIQYGTGTALEFGVEKSYTSCTHSACSPRSGNISDIFTQ